MAHIGCGISCVNIFNYVIEENNTAIITITTKKEFNINKRETVKLKKWVKSKSPFTSWDEEIL